MRNSAHKRTQQLSARNGAGTIPLSFRLARAMMDQACTAPTPCDPEIARYEVSEDGVTWRPYDPKHDEGQPLHRRIDFAPPVED
jgi:hypothetical protein